VMAGAIDSIELRREFLLHLADNALVLGQRNAEWCGHGPVLEEDIALANISLDLVGQARLIYQHVATLDGPPNTEDKLAYFRDAQAFRNCTMLELPHNIQGTDERDYAVTIVRNFLFSSWMLLRWDALLHSSDTQLAAIAERAIKETRYHLRHSRDWLIRLGDGTPESHSKTQAALDYLMPFAPELWAQCAMETEATRSSVCPSVATLHAPWWANVKAAMTEATLTLAPVAQAATGLTLRPHGKTGIHSAHLAPLLADMQSLARAHPEATW
jgi:ring-1,2-phenylacetyl-CoA epoxidase subunit PaaC